MPGEEGIKKCFKSPLSFELGKEAPMEAVELDGGDHGEDLSGENGCKDPQASNVKIIEVGENNKIMEKDDEAGSAE